MTTEEKATLDKYVDLLKSIQVCVCLTEEPAIEDKLMEACCLVAKKIHEITDEATE